MLGQRDARIVAGLHDHPHQKILDPHPCADFDKHARPGRSPGALGDRYFVVELDLPLTEGLKDHIRCHDLGETGRCQRRVGIEGRQFVPGCAIDNQVALGTDDRRRRGRHH